MSLHIVGNELKFIRQIIQTLVVCCENLLIKEAINCAKVTKKP